MSIKHINGAAIISGFNGQENQQQPDQHTQDEEFVLEYLKLVHNLSDAQALSTLFAMIEAGIDMGDLVFDLQSDNPTADATIDAFKGS